MVEEKHSLEDWVHYLGKEQMPALAETVQKLNRLTTDEAARVSHLTDQVLKDPSLTSRVLRVSNCVMYKGTGGQIKTITRAIVMLGFATVRDVSLSMQILDNVLKHNPSRYLMTMIANSFHAAMQARGMMPQTRLNQQEEVFISTLLLHFAELSLLSRDDEVSRKLNYLIGQEQATPAQAALSVLGCPFNDISLALARQWNLGDVLQEALAPSAAPSRPAQAVLLGDELSQVAMQGWDAPPVREVIKKIAKFREVDFKDAHGDVMKMAALAHEMAVHYGAAKVRHLIPHPDMPLGSSDGKPVPVTVEGKPARPTSAAGTGTPESIAVPASARPVPQAQDEDEGIEDLIELALGGGNQQYPDSATEYARKQEQPKESVTQNVVNAEMQFSIMQQLSRLLSEKGSDVNAMLGLIMDAMNGAIGLDRVVMALTTRDRKSLVPRLFKGETGQAFKDAFKFRLDEENPFTVALTQSQQLWMGSKLMAGRAYLHSAQMQKVLGYKEYFVAPIIVARKPVGIFYGDCALTKRPLNDAQFAAFNMFAQQAGLALAAAKS